VTSPRPTGDWLLTIAGLSFFAGIFFGSWGLMVGPAYLLLSLSIQKLVDRQIASRKRENRKEEFRRAITLFVGHARGEPCNCKKLRQFPRTGCMWEAWTPADPQQTTNRINHP